MCSEEWSPWLQPGITMVGFRWTLVAAWTPHGLEQFQGFMQKHKNIHQAKADAETWSWCQDSEQHGRALTVFHPSFIFVTFILFLEILSDKNFFKAFKEIEHETIYTHYESSIHQINQGDYVLICCIKNVIINSHKYVF